MPLIKATKATAKATNGVLDRMVVDYLGSLLTKLPDGIKMLTGCCLVGASWIATGIFGYASFDDGWNQTLIQQILDWMNYIGLGALAVGGADKLLDAQPPQATMTGKPHVDATRGDTMQPMEPVK